MEPSGRKTKEDITLLITISVIVISILLFFIFKRTRSTRRGILLTGLCDSGKTLIFSELLHNKQVKTHTSIKVNIEQYICKDGTLKIIDIPGHERLRDKFFEEYKSAARGIVFVVDSLTLPQDIRDAAEFLYNILVDPVVAKNCPEILILCNKQDQSFAKGGGAVRSIFERELNTLRVTKSRQLQSVDAKAKKNALLGDPEKDFNFASLPYKIDFAESYATHKNGTYDIEGLKKWIARQV